MSYTTITQAARDEHLFDRTTAAVNQEVIANPTLADTDFGRQVAAGGGNITRLMYPLAVDTEAAYASAVAADNPDPGGDESVITDGMILAAVQTHWPTS